MEITVTEATVATLKEFEDALRQAGMSNALAILDTLKKRDREKRSIAPARRIAGKKMTAELARTVLELHASTGMTQQEIAFKLGVNQGRVNEVVKRGKWLNGDPVAAEVLSRDKAMDRLKQRAKARRAAAPATTSHRSTAAASVTPKSATPLVQRPTPARRAPAAPVMPGPIVSAQLAFMDL